jgi:hypothetical protein
LNHVYPDMGWWDFLFPWDFLLYEPYAVERNLEDLALGFYARGTGFVNARTSWEPDATSFTLVSTDYVQSHQHLDQNHFVLYKNGRLATDGNVLSDTGIEQMTRFHCTFLVDGTGQGPWQVARDSTGVIVSYENDGRYTYAAGEAADAYNYDGVTRLNSFFRQFVFFRSEPEVVPASELPSELGISLTVSPVPIHDGATVKLRHEGHDRVTVSVYDLAGHFVGTLWQGEASAGEHSWWWNTKALTSGAYVIDVKTGTWRATQPVVVR